MGVPSSRCKEIFGVNANIRGIADDLAAKGYLAVAPDLFWRQRPGVDLDPADPASRETAMALLGGLDWKRAAADAAAAATWLQQQPAVTGKVGVIGFCMGGNLAYQMAANAPVAGVVVYYGTNLHKVLKSSQGFPGEMLIHVAGADYLCPPDAQAEIAETFRANDRVKVLIHPGAEHAFARSGAAHFHPEAAGRANAETDAFLSRLLTVAS